MDYYPIIARNFQATIETIMSSVDILAAPLEQASQVMTRSLLEDRKIMACGLGVDGALAQLLSCNLLSRFEHERPALPALSLGTDCNTVTAIVSGNGIDEVFSRQVRALGQAGDVLFCIDSGPGSAAVVRAIQAARERNMSVVALSNAGCVELGQHIHPGDVELQINATRQPLVIEMQTMVINCLCELIDHSLFGSYE